MKTYPIADIDFILKNHLVLDAAARLRHTDALGVASRLGYTDAFESVANRMNSDLRNAGIGDIDSILKSQSAFGVASRLGYTDAFESVTNRINSAVRNATIGGIDSILKSHSSLGLRSHINDQAFVNFSKNFESHFRTAVMMAKSADLATLNSIEFDSTFLEEKYDILNEEIVQQQLEDISKAKDPETFNKLFNAASVHAKRIICCFLVVIFGLIVQSYYEEFDIKRLLPGISTTTDSLNPNLIDQPSRAKAKTLKSLPIEGLDKNYSRFVSIEYLDVYAKPNQKSKILDELIFGQIVVILIKERNWVEIAFRNENGELHYGWVFNRYLKKFH